jgi:hypothetical protein
MMRRAGRAGALLFALGVQAGFALLLLFSFTVIRLVAPPEETILHLPQIRPQPKVIDARQPPREPRALPPPSAPPAPAQLPAYALPGYALPGAGGVGGGSGILQALGRNLANCRLETLDKRDAATRCPPGLTPPDQRIVTLDGRTVKNAPVWQAEVDRRNAPFVLPGGAMGPLGILVTALVNPSAFSDPKAYAAPAPPERISGAEALQQRRYNDPVTSLTGTDYENRIRRDSAGSAMHVK